MSGTMVVGKYGKEEGRKPVPSREGGEKEGTEGRKEGWMGLREDVRGGHHAELKKVPARLGPSSQKVG